MAINLLKNLNFAEIINNNDAITESGKEMLKRYRGFCYSNPVSCSTVNSFVNEAKNFRFDTGLVNIMESVLNYINENNISWKLASACEKINNNDSTYSYIAKLGVGQVEKLLEMKESDVVSYIKSGALKNVQYIPEFRAICKNVYKTTVNEVKNEQFTVTNPVSYVLLENNAQIFSVLGKTYCIEDNTIFEYKCDDETFNTVNAHLQGLKKVDENLEYEYKTTLTGPVTKYVISDDCITFTRGNNINESFDKAENFLQYSDNLSKTMPAYERVNFMNIANAIAQVYENMDNIVVLDCVNLINTTNGTSCAIIECEDETAVDVYRSYQHGNGFTNYNTISEACKEVQRIANVNVSGLFTERINEEAKKADPEGYEEIKEQLSEAKANKINERRQRIAFLAEKYKNDPTRIALLNHTAKELSLLDA